MAAIRIGNNIELFWRLKYAGTDTPFPLVGKTLLFQMVVKGQIINVKDYDVTDGEIHWFYYGKDQSEIGIYDLKLVVNPGQIDQIVFDKEDAFSLVRHSWEVDPDAEADIEVITIDIDSEVSGDFLNRVWLSLKTNTDSHGADVIHKDHVPDINVYIKDWEISMLINNAFDDADNNL